MIVAIHQPDYIPWLGLYYKMAHCDVFIYLDDAQYSNEADHNVNLIKTPQGALRLKVPVQQHLGDLIYSVRTRDELKWKEKHLRTLRMNYKRAPYFDEIFPRFAEIIDQHQGSISELNMAINRYICDGFGISPRILKSSEMNVAGAKEARVIDLCIRAGGDEYLSGNGARVYQKDEHFAEKGLKLTYLDYKPIQYPQLWGEFLPCMSVVDYIFNCGFDWQRVEDLVKEANAKGEADA